VEEGSRYVPEYPGASPCTGRTSDFDECGTGESVRDTLSPVGVVFSICLPVVSPAGAGSTTGYCAAKPSAWGGGLVGRQGTAVPTKGPSHGV